jgi:DnaJ-like protein
MIEQEKTSYPLCWPAGRARVLRHQRRVAKFETGFTKVRDSLVKEIHLLGGKDLILSTNVQLKRDGMPYANWKTPDDNGAAVYFKRKGKELCFACDCWVKLTDNLHAINLTIGALRGIARWGTGDMMEAAFTGFMALPAPGQSSGDSPWTILGVAVNATEEQISEAYRTLAKKAHPDAGGSHEAFNRIKTAYDLMAQNLRSNGH